MPHQIYPLREVVRKSSDTDPDTLRTGPVESGWTWIVTSYSFEDETNGATSARAFVETADYVFPLEEQVTLTAGVLYDGDKRTILTEGDRFGARFVGPTASDELALYVLGYKLPPGLEVTPALLVALAERS